MALVNRGYLHYTYMKKFLKKFSSLKPLVRFEMMKCSLDDLFQKLLVKVDQSINMALVNGEYKFAPNRRDFKKSFSLEIAGQILK